MDPGVRRGDDNLGRLRLGWPKKMLDAGHGCAGSG